MDKQNSSRLLRKSLGMNPDSLIGVNNRSKIAIYAAKKAGKMLAENFQKKTKVSTKKDGSLVTQFDLKSEKIIIDIIKKRFPTDNILSEESDNLNFNSNFTWIIDPIDGTHNYIRNIEIFGVSIGIQYKEEIVAGVIFIPLTNELYTTEKGKGAFKNGKRLKVSNKDLKNSTMIYDSTIKLAPKKMSKALKKLSLKTFNLRMLGSTVRSLTYIAEGKAEIEIEFNDKIWDFAAGMLLVREAGGIFTDFKGDKNLRVKQTYIASNKKVYKEALKILENLG